MRDPKTVAKAVGWASLRCLHTAIQVSPSRKRCCRTRWLNGGNQWLQLLARGRGLRAHLRRSESSIRRWSNDDDAADAARKGGR